LHVSRGPLVRHVELSLSVATDAAGSVTLTRVPNEPTDPERFEVTWRLVAEGARTRIELQLDANLDVPRIVPLGRVGDSMAEGFMDAARREMED
jgi:hypothetical protein